MPVLKPIPDPFIYSADLLNKIKRSAIQVLSYKINTSGVQIQNIDKEVKYKLVISPKEPKSMNQMMQIKQY